MTELTINNRKCHIYNLGKGGPIVFWGMANRRDDTIENLIEYLTAFGLPCTLLAFEAEDWNSDFSPWEMHTGDMYFAGCGSLTLKWLLDAAVPYVREHYPKTDTYLIAGYSLSGLFALWSFYETDVFRGAACCSGSLWFEGWDEYADSKTAPVGSIVYLSLGGKESNSPNPLMAAIGKKCRAQERRCKNDKNIAKTVLEMNPGGHFANPAKRIAKGIIWMLKELYG